MPMAKDLAGFCVSLVVAFALSLGCAVLIWAATSVLTRLFALVWLVE